MRFHIAENQAFEELGASETLGDVVRVGFNRVDFEPENGKVYNCYELSGGKVRGERWDYEKQETDVKWFDENIPIDQSTIYLDRDEDQFTIVGVKELV